MHISEVEPAPTAVTVGGPSLALELSWATHSVWSPRLRTQHRILDEVAGTHREILSELRRFWNDEGEGFVEVEVLAYLAGALEETEFDPLFDAMDLARARIPPDLPFRAETPAARDVINARLGDLRRNDERWRNYRSLFVDLYEPLDQWWHRVGAPTAERAVSSTRRALAQGGEWRRMVSSDCVQVTERIAQLPERHEPVLLVPCALFGKGLYLDLPGCQLIGLSAGMGELGARTRTGDLARTMRVLADPTRLAILDHLQSGERSISDLALDFGLAQPTISVHVKQLRQAGLVTATRRGPRLDLSVDADAVAVIADRLSDLVRR